MKISDYLHYYLQSNIGVYVFPDETITDGFLARYKEQHPDGVFAPKLTFETYNQFLRDGYKPILRRTADITKDEAAHLALIYSGAKSVERTKGVADNWHYYFCYHGDNKEGELLIIAADGCAWYAHYFDMEQPGHRNIVNEYKAFHYLLQQQFDLFGLIDVGLAIDAKTIQP